MGFRLILRLECALLSLCRPAARRYFSPVPAVVRSGCAVSVRGLHPPAFTISFTCKYFGSRYSSTFYVFQYSLFTSIPQHFTVFFVYIHPHFPCRFVLHSSALGTFDEGFGERSCCAGLLRNTRLSRFGVMHFQGTLPSFHLFFRLPLWLFLKYLCCYTVLCIYLHLLHIASYSTFHGSQYSLFTRFPQHFYCIFRLHSHSQCRFVLHTSALGTFDEGFLERTLRLSLKDSAAQDFCISRVPLLHHFTLSLCLFWKYLFCNTVLCMYLHLLHIGAHFKLVPFNLVLSTLRVSLNDPAAQRVSGIPSYDPAVPS